jgi:hypothetical protein
LAPTPIEQPIAPQGASETTSREQGFELCFGLPDTAQDVLLEDVLELSAPTTRALTRWRDGWIKVAARRQRTVNELVGAREAGITEG